MDMLRSRPRPNGKLHDACLAAVRAGSRAERFAKIDGEMVDRLERPVAAACYLLRDFLC